MRIASRETVPGRSHQAAGKMWTFNPAEPGGPNVCDVDDPAAQAVFLDQRNANLFYAVDVDHAPLQRNVTVHKTQSVGKTELLHDALLTILAEPVAKIVPALATLDLDQLAALEQAETADKARKGVLSAIADERARRAASQVNPADAGAALLLDNDLEVVLQLLGQVTDANLRAAALRLEQANQQRAEIIAALTA